MVQYFTIILSTLILLFMLTTVVEAGETTNKKDKERLEREQLERKLKEDHLTKLKSDAQSALKVCVSEVHSQSGSTRQPFDAFSSVNDGSVNMFGTKYEIFLFRKCMNKYDHPLDETNK